MREFIDRNGNLVEDAVEIADPSISPYAGATRWTEKKIGNGHWYAWINEAMPRKDAVAWATARGGYLARFELPAEVEFALSLTDPFCCTNWVGGSQLQPGLEPAGSWMWDTGVFITDLDWADNEPNDQSSLTGGTEKYLQIYTSNVYFGRFNDAAGDQLRTFVVEWDGAMDCNGNGRLDGGEIIDGMESDLKSNRVPDPCEALLVPDEYVTIQSAIDAVADGGVILVGPGTYQKHINLRP